MSKTDNDKRFYQTKPFQELRRRWEQRLSDSGFRDIETIGADGEVTAFFRDRKPLGSDYKEKVARRMHDLPFKAEYFHRAERMARARLGGMQPFWVSTALAMHALGAYKSEIARAVGKSVRTVTPVVDAFAIVVRAGNG